ncbi:hypothetical protein [Actinoplanes sp. M2I2]|uniref:hypothetical protein n=1 Tax=Actinoplanes sp. M2I2 TaxID=1734444 RepID=UPI0020225094|nr:hypothetical protein [Actinoplanes sp. M2I2]
MVTGNVRPTVDGGPQRRVKVQHAVRLPGLVVADGRLDLVGHPLCEPGRSARHLRRHGQDPNELGDPDPRRVAQLACLGDGQAGGVAGQVGEAQVLQRVDTHVSNLDEVAAAQATEQVGQHRRDRREVVRTAGLHHRLHVVVRLGQLADLTPD